MSGLANHDHNKPTYASSCPSLTVVEEHPIIDPIVLLAQRLQYLAKQLPQEVVIWALLEPKLANIVHVDRKLLREALAQLLDWRALLLLADLLVLLLIGLRPKTLPWQPAPQEVHEDVSERLEVIPPGLLPAQVRVDGHVPGSPGERLALSVGDVHLGLWVAVVLCHAEVLKLMLMFDQMGYFLVQPTDDVDSVGVLRFGDTDQEVVRLDVTIDEGLVMDRLYPTDLFRHKTRKKSAHVRLMNITPMIDVLWDRGREKKPKDQPSVLRPCIRS
jgi:hypothetical protein